MGVLFISINYEKVKAKYQELVTQYSDSYLVIYDLLFDTKINYMIHLIEIYSSIKSEGYFIKGKKKNDNN